MNQIFGQMFSHVAVMSMQMVIESQLLAQLRLKGPGAQKKDTFYSNHKSVFSDNNYYGMGTR